MADTVAQIIDRRKCMENIVICEICGDYVEESELTQCTICKKDCCEKCISFEDVICNICNL